MSKDVNGQTEAEDLDYITPDDIALFRRTLLARRFPGLQKLSEGELIALIRAERKATGRKLVRERKTHPKTTFTPPPPKRGQLQPQSIPFVPVNPFQAKQQSSRLVTERFIGVDTPYEGHRDDFNLGRTTDENRRLAPFVPTCSSQARDTVRIKYHLNSPMNTTVALGKAQQQGGTGAQGSSRRSTAQ